MKRFKGLILITLLLGFFIGINSTAHAGVAVPYYTWDIEKIGDQTDLTLAIGQQFLVNYEVNVVATFHDIGIGDPVHATGVVNDSIAGQLGVVDATEQTSYTYNYSWSVGPYADPGDYPFNNTASLSITDDGAISSNTWVINVNVPRNTEPVPEPATMFLLGTGLVGVAGAARRRWKT